MAQPDVTLLLDMGGVIREATLSSALPEEDVESWLGQPWVDTVADFGSDKVKRMVDDARATGISAFRQITQRFPSGLQLPMEYTTVLLGGRAGLLAVGKNLQAVAELQSQLIAAQQAMERDSWKLREIETRYRLLFDVSNEAVVLVRASNLRIVEANAAAGRALGANPRKTDGLAGRELLSTVAPEDREPLQSALSRAREQGKAPGILLRFGQSRSPWLVRISLMASDPGAIFFLQLAAASNDRPSPERLEAVEVEDLFERVPDGFVVIDREGTIHRANRAFLDLVEVGAMRSIVGEKLGRWLGRPGADVSVLLDNIARYGLVRLFTTTMTSELGTETDVEISATGSSESAPDYVGVLLRDVGRRLQARTSASHLDSFVESITEQVGKTSLRKLVKDAVVEVERHYVKTALELSGGNRTAAADLLGLSRQSLYVKLNRYGLETQAE